MTKMDEEFLKKIVAGNRSAESYPSVKGTAEFIEHLLALLFPNEKKYRFTQPAELTAALELNRSELKNLLGFQKDMDDSSADKILDRFYRSLPDLYELMMRDAKAIEAGDPAACNLEEVIFTYPGFYATTVYRVAHKLQQLGIRCIPRILTEHAHGKTGIDIHPSAEIGQKFCIDHGTGVVIGETTRIGEEVKIYQGVTLGALSVSKKMAKEKRHPTIGDRVVIYAGATILGGKCEIGHDSVIGGNVWLTESVAPHSRVYHESKVIIQQQKKT